MNRGGGAVADVIVVGDGPAGLALATTCTDEGIDALVVGNGRRWTATYATWVDDVPAHTSTLATRSPVDVVATARRRLAREYGVFDNERLRASLDRSPHTVADVVGVEHARANSTVLTAAGERLAARLVVDATGFRPVLARAPAARRGACAVQSAYGLVLRERPQALDGDAAVLMDWRLPAGDASTDTDGGADPTFLYAVPLPEGRWLVEETSLARGEPLPEATLRHRLAGRLGRDLTDAAEAVERVLIPMGAGVPRGRERVVAFGAAAGYVHPATGYSVAASLRAAPRLARALSTALGRTEDPVALARAAWESVWPREQRHARALHAYGLTTVRRMTRCEIAVFFDAFFSLPDAQWSAYLRTDTTGREVAAAMAAVFRSVPWALRRRLASGSPSAFAALLR